MKNIYRLILLFIFLSSCNSTCAHKNIEISELLSIATEEKSIDYCKLLNSSLSGNEDSIKEISLLEFGDAVGYDHGSVIVDLILEIGEEKYLRSIFMISKEEKYLINSYLDVGLIYGNNPKVDKKDLKSTFPKIYDFLKR